MVVLIVPARILVLSARRGGLASCCEGAAILEFALILPILLALFAGCFELGRAMLIYQTMHEAVRSGARALARMPDSTCFPDCTPGAEGARETARMAIAGRGWVGTRNVRIETVRDAGTGTITMRAEVGLATDLLAGIGLSRVLTLRATHQEVRIEE